MKILYQTRAYLDYVIEHYENVQKAWELVQKKCKDEKFICDDDEYSFLDHSIKYHDVSKLDNEEFLAYRDKFYPFTKSVDQSLVELAFDNAWKHHKNNNDHHWETWTTESYAYPRAQTLHCIHMLVDWIAMGMKFGDTALEYYQKNKHKMKLEEWDEFIVEILNKVYKK